MKYSYLIAPLNEWIAENVKKGHEDLSYAIRMKIFKALWIKEDRKEAQRNQIWSTMASIMVQ